MNTELKSAQAEPTHTNEELYHKQNFCRYTILKRKEVYMG